MDILSIIQAAIILLIMGILLGILLGYADKFLKVKQDPRLEKINKLMPGYNCGVCGHPGCSAFATALLEGSGKLSECKPLKPDDAAEIRLIMDSN